MLSNVYLHEVLDSWFERVVKPVLEGRGALIRYADDFVIVLEQQKDAERVMKAIAKRCAKHGLTIHPDKTRLVCFRRPALTPNGTTGKGPGSFDFLGFTHFWCRTRKGKWAVRRKTSSKRLKRAIGTVQAFCRRNRHEPVREQQQALNRKLRGHYNYYGIIWNYQALGEFFYHVRVGWRKWLNRRGARRPMSWERFEQLLRHYPLLKPRVVHGLSHP